MTLRPLVAVAIVFGISAAVLLANHQDTPLRRDQRGPGDQRQVDAYTKFVTQHFIQANPPLLTVREHTAPGVPVVDLASSVYGDPDALAYANISHLLEDIRRDDPSIWTIENGKVTAIEPYRYVQPPPFSERRGWSGSIFYREPAGGRDKDVITLTSDAGRVAIRLTPAAPALITGDPSLGALRLPMDQVGPVAAPLVHVFCGGGDWMARIWRIGDQAAISVGTDACKVQIGLQTLSVGAMAPIPPGSSVSFVERSGRRFVLTRPLAGDAEPTLSAPSAAGGRTLDPDSGIWAAAADRDYKRALLLGSEGGEGKDDSFRASLDGQLQPALQRGLESFVDALPLNHNDRPRIAAALIMDATTGEVLGMASYPRAKLGESIDPLDAQRRSELRTNYNLEALPIGSAAKPLLAAAILTDQPGLAKLQIAGRSGPVADLLGLRLSSVFEGDSKVSRVDFDHFIQNSDNAYAASLLLLSAGDNDPALKVQLGPDERFWLCAPSLDCKPQSERVKSIFEASDGHGGFKPAIPDGRTLSWVATFHDLFDANTAGPGAPRGEPKPVRCSNGAGRYGSDQREASVWRLLLDSRSWLNPCGFTETPPAREALGLERPRNFRTDFLTVILGNGEGRWTTVKLAEAYSRLVTGRQIRASFVHGQPPDRAALPLAPSFTAQPVITHAMTLVTQGSGTAAGTHMPKALDGIEQALAKQGLVLGVFSKTGTPALPFAEFTPADKAIDLLIHDDRLRLGPEQKVAVFADGRLYPLTSDARRDAVLALARDLQAAEALRRFHVSADAVVARLIEDNADVAKGGKPFVAAGDLLIRVATKAEQLDEAKQKSKGKVFATVLAAYRPGPDLRLDGRRAADGSTLPVHAYTIVVNIQYPLEQTGNSAADFAADVATLLSDRLAGVKRTN